MVGKATECGRSIGDYCLHGSGHHQLTKKLRLPTQNQSRTASSTFQKQSDFSCENKKYSDKMTAHQHSADGVRGSLEGEGATVKCGGCSEAPAEDSVSVNLMKHSHRKSQLTGYTSTRGRVRDVSTLRWSPGSGSISRPAEPPGSQAPCRTVRGALCLR